MPPLSSQSKRSRFSKNRTSKSSPHSDSQMPDEAENDEDRTPASPPTRRLLVTVFSIAACWGIVLIGLVIFTANPVTLNRLQFIRAELAVTAEVTDRDKGTVKVKKVWWSRTSSSVQEETTFKVKGLQEANVKQGETYLFPLFRNQSGEYLIVPVRMGEEETSLVYPANESALEQLEAIAQKRNQPRQ